MKIKAKGGTLKRVPSGLPYSMVTALREGKEVEVDEIPHRLIGLVEEVKQSKPKKETK